MNCRLLPPSLPNARFSATSLLLAATLATQALAAGPSVEQALKLKPLQPGVVCDLPSAEEQAKCKIQADVSENSSGWVVLDPLGRLLRRFVDTNSDQRVDQWCYYKDGIEVYRDVDADFDGKADQYRWLGTAGTRWGLDPDEDGQIDRWKTISAEEVAEEVVAALRDHDVQRFLRLLPSTAELNALGLGDDRQEELLKRVQAARAGFEDLAKQRSLVPDSAQWLQFGANRPGIIPAGTAGSKKDLLVYDNVAAIIESDGQPAQIMLGTLVHTDDGWRLIDLPRKDAGEGLLYATYAPAAVAPFPSTGDVPETNQDVQEWLGQLEQIDQALPSADAARRATLHAQRADVLEKLARHAQTAQDRENWMRQMADLTSAAVQSGEYPDGIDRLKQWASQLASQSPNSPLVPYVRFRYLTAHYGLQLQKPNNDYAKIQEQWLKDLEAFVRQYPDAEEAPEAILQLAIAQEFAGQEDEAIRWYDRIVRDFADAPVAPKAAGAKRRLESEGKSMPLRAPSATGKMIDLNDYRGRVVVVHYWATWCEPCKEDMKTIKSLLGKYAARGFAAVGVNLDSDEATFKRYVEQNQVSWPQAYESGGLDSRLANEMGILTLPTMILIDSSGRVVRKNVHIGELEQELARLLR